MFENSIFPSPRSGRRIITRRRRGGFKIRQCSVGGRGVFVFTTKTRGSTLCRPHANTHMHTWIITLRFKSQVVEEGTVEIGWFERFWTLTSDGVPPELERYEEMWVFVKIVLPAGFNCRLLQQQHRGIQLLSRCSFLYWVTESGEIYFPEGSNGTGLLQEVDRSNELFKTAHTQALTQAVIMFGGNSIKWQSSGLSSNADNGTAFGLKFPSKI